MSKDSIYIVAGGTSLKNFNFSKLKDKDVIAVNKSIIDVPFAKYFVTMDYTFIDNIKSKTSNKLSKEVFYHTPAEKYFIVARDNKYIAKTHIGYVDLRSDYKYNLNNFHYIVDAYNSIELGNSFETFCHGCNSGFCAFQLALILGYKKIYLLGVDLNAETETHYHGGYFESIKSFSRKLKVYNFYFTNGILMAKELYPDVEIFNCSSISTLKKFTEYFPLEKI